MTDPVDIEEITDGALLEDLVAAFKRKRDPGEFEEWPSDEQMEMLKRGGK
jgi:hypothetical protein